MRNATDDGSIELLEADEFWPRIIADDQFWRKYEALEPDEQVTAFMTRITTDPAFIAEASKEVRELHAKNGGLIIALIEMVGLAEARKRLQRSQH